MRERTHLYGTYIQPVFSELVDKIVYTYKFTSLPNIDALRAECKIWLVTILPKYNPEKAKAFSYFSVITKNWFIHKIKRHNKKRRTEIEIVEELSKELELKYISTTNPYQKHREHEEFFGFLRNEINSWDQIKMKENEEKVLNAVKILFDSAEDIEIFNKKAIYLYLREITGLNTKQVVNNLNKMRARYSVFREKWDKGDL
jgi:DNA-directed RNA polymerase specialized sigma subunit